MSGENCISEATHPQTGEVLIAGQEPIYPDKYAIVATYVDRTLESDVGPVRERQSNVIKLEGRSGIDPTREEAEADLPIAEDVVVGAKLQVEPIYMDDHGGIHLY